MSNIEIKPAVSAKEDQSLEIDKNSDVMEIDSLDMFEFYEKEEKEKFTTLSGSEISESELSESDPENEMTGVPMNSPVSDSMLEPPNADENAMDANDIVNLSTVLQETTPKPKELVITIPGQGKNAVVNASKPVNRKRKHDEQNQFQNKRNKWLRLEKLPAHRRLPPKTDETVQKWSRSIDFRTTKELTQACKYQNWDVIHKILAEAATSKNMLTAPAVRKLSIAILHAIYKGFKTKRYSLPLEMFPRYLRASIASVNLSDPTQLLAYMKYPSLGYRLNNVNTAELIWRRVDPKVRAKMYRMAFENGAALIRKQ
jgi:hypothetical protein